MSEEKNIVESQETVNYDEGNIQTLTGLQHIRLRPGMYIGRLGDGSSAEDGIYVLLKEVFDNSIDEFKMKAGDRIEVTVEDHLRISVRDYGRGIPQGKLIESVSILNTSGKFDSKAFKKSIGLNGVGVKAVNALSSRFEVHSYRDGKVRKAVFECGELVSDVTEPTQDENGTYIYFEPDNTKFVNYQFHDEIVENMLRNYTYLNIGLTIMYNGRRILSRHGLEDLLKDRMTNDALYPIIHLQERISRLPLPMPTNMVRSTTLSSMVSIPHRVVRIRVLSRSISPVPSRSSSTSMSMGISERVSLPLSPSMSRSPSSRVRQRSS